MEKTMENITKKKPNLGTILLMAAGIIFVLVSGSIFVSSTWKLLSETTKQICILIVTAGFFTGSIFLREKTKLASNALYYLGTAGMGFFTYAIFGFLTSYANVENMDITCLRLCAVDIMLIIALVIHLFMEKLVPDLVMLYFMLVGFVLTFTAGFAMGIKAFMFMFVMLTLIMSLADVIMRNHADDDSTKKLSTALGVCYVLQSVYSAVFVMTMGVITPWLSSGLMTKTLYGSSDMFSTVIALMFLAAMLITMHFREEGFFRFTSTAALFMFTMNFQLDAVRLFEAVFPTAGYLHAEIRAIIFAAFTVGLGLLWRDSDKMRKPVSVVQFIITVCILFGMLAHNLQYEKIECLLVFAISTFIMFVISAFLSNRKYQIASGITLVLTVFYLTRSFWLSISWWVYLFVAGIICIGISIGRELRNNSGNA